MEKRFDENCDRIISCNDIIERLEEKSARDYACDWDNVGLLVGRKEREVNRVMVALDATMEVVKAACDMGCDMLITHHPLIFSPVKKITDDSILGKKLLLLAEHGVSCYAMHTNFDTVGNMASVVTDIFLGLESTDIIEKHDVPGAGMGRIAFLPKPMTKDEICEYVKERLELTQVTFHPAAPDGEEISDDKVFHKIAVMPGSGKSFIDRVVGAGCDLYLTGDIGYHEAQNASELGLSIIDATHDGLEKVFACYIANYIKSYFPFADIKDVNGETKTCKIPYSVILQKVDNEYFDRNR